MAFIDKINPDVPEGRLLIRNGDYVLKDPEAEVSSIPLDKKWKRDLIIFNQTKTGKPQIIPLRPVVGNAILEYVQEERPQSDLPYIFLSKRKANGHENN